MPNKRYEIRNFFTQIPGHSELLPRLRHEANHVPPASRSLATRGPELMPPVRPPQMARPLLTYQGALIRGGRINCFVSSVPGSRYRLHELVKKQGEGKQEGG